MVPRGGVAVMKTVFLIGYMGCGKTTLGEVLARQMGVPFIDLDEYIEHQQGMTIVEIFAHDGEDRFRELEKAALRQVATIGGAIIACGGGTPCHAGNMELMNQAGITVWLTTSPERITARLLMPDQKAKRPKYKDLPEEAVLPLVKQELEARSPYYSQACLHFDSTDIETAAATARTARGLAILLQPHLEAKNKGTRTRN